MEFKYDLHLELILAAAFLPVIINFALLVFHPEKANEMGKVLIWQMGGLLLMPFLLIAGMRLGGLEKNIMGQVLLIAECAAGLLLAFFAFRDYRKFKGKIPALPWAIGAFSLFFWGFSLWKLVSGYK